MRGEQERDDARNVIGDAGADWLYPPSTILD